MENSIENFREQMEQGGLIVGSIVEDGRVHRCGTTEKPKAKNGWYVFFPDHPASGAFGDWQTGQTVKWTSRNGDCSSADRALFQKRIEAAQRARREEEVKRQAAAKERARKILDRCTPVPF